MEQLDVAYSNPLVLGLHHHAQGMELTKLQLKSFEAGDTIFNLISRNFSKSFTNTNGIFDFAKKTNGCYKRSPAANLVCSSCSADKRTNHYSLNNPL
jgi:hypothetical protein